MAGQIEFDREKCKRLREAYDEAIAAGKGGNDTFMFEGHEFVVDFAKYLLEYVRPQDYDSFIEVVAGYLKGRFGNE